MQGLAPRPHLSREQALEECDDGLGGSSERAEYRAHVGGCFLRLGDDVEHQQCKQPKEEILLHLRRHDPHSLSLEGDPIITYICNMSPP